MTAANSGARPLFVFGIARSGTNLIARMLDAHPMIAVALDPLMPLFKAFRNTAVATMAPPDLAARFDPAGPFQDYYGSCDGPALLDLTLTADLELPIAAQHFPELRTAVAARAGLESRDLPPALASLEGGTFRATVESLLSIVATVQGGPDLAYAGVKEVWTIDFIPALARAFPLARFVIIERDPRGILASLSALADRDPSQRAHAVSYLRHWRKNIVLARHFEADPRLAGNLMRIAYEDLASRPASVAEDVCKFLGIDIDPAMLDLGRVPDRVTGGRWRGNSSHRVEGARISPDSVAIWRSVLSPETVAAADRLCGPEMLLTGYRPGPADEDSGDALHGFMMDADRQPGSWRSDAGDPISDWGVESMRQQLLSGPALADPALVRRCFLFDWCLHALRAGTKTTDDSEADAS